MASAPDDDHRGEVLRTKYAELARKYSDLVERLGRRAAHDLGIYRLGSFDVRITGAALALVSGGTIQVGNARFIQLSRSIKGPLIAAEPDAAPPYDDLRALVLAWSERLLRERTPAIEIRYRDAASDALVSLRLERSVQAAGAVTLVLAEDVSENVRRDRELARTRHALLDRERLRVLGELAASIAHDLGNTLRGASFQLAALRDNTLTAESRVQALRAVEERVEIASEMIARLHDFARSGAVGESAVRLDRIVAQAVALVDIDFHESAAPVNVRTSIPDLPALRGSVAELSLLFVNLLRNARDAMPEGGTVTVAARREKNALVVTVSDEGTGLPASVQARLFEPFFTTKGSRGTGLGLWLAAGTMERLGGSIRAANLSRGGAIFVLTFPLEQPTRRGRRRVSATRRAGARPAPSAPAPRRRPRARRNASRT